jgi:hypothetical protein
MYKRNATRKMKSMRKRNATHKRKTHKKRHTSRMVKRGGVGTPPRRKLNREPLSAQKRRQYKEAQAHLAELDQLLDKESMKEKNKHYGFEFDDKVSGANGKYYSNSHKK